MHRNRSGRIPVFAPNRIVVLTGLALASISLPASATLITAGGTGIFNAGNGAVAVSGNGATNGCIEWYNSGAAPIGCPAGSGNFTVDDPSTAPFVVGLTGTIQDLPFNPTVPLVDFMTVGISGGLTAHFDLKDLRFNGATAVGDCTTAVGTDGRSDTSPFATCVPAFSPFQLTNGPANGSGVVDTVTVSLTLDAYGYTGSSGTNYNQANLYIGRFTTQGAVAGFHNIDDILTAIRNNQTVTASWSASFSPVAGVPEPGSYMLLGMGLLAIGGIRRKARKA